MADPLSINDKLKALMITNITQFFVHMGNPDSFNALLGRTQAYTPVAGCPNDSLMGFLATPQTGALNDRLSQFLT